MRDWMLIVLTAGTFFGYYGLPLAQRPWAYYVATGGLMLTLALCLRPFVRSRVGSLALAIVAVESTLHTLCGAATWGLLSTGEDLCKRWIGPDWYHVIGSLAVAALLTWGVRWRKRT